MNVSDTIGGPLVERILFGFDADGYGVPKALALTSMKGDNVELGAFPHVNVFPLSSTIVAVIEPVVIVNRTRPVAEFAF